MSFHQKSAWIMALALLLGGAMYLIAVASLSGTMGQLAPPTIPQLITYTLILVLVAIVGHTIIGIMAPKEANAPIDERERKIFDRAGHLSGIVFGLGVVASLAYYLYSSNGDLLFYSVFASLMAGQLAEYLLQIYLYRTAI